MIEKGFVEISAHNLLRSCGMLVLLVIIPCVTFAQGDFQIGFGGGYEFGIPLTIQRRDDIISRYNFDGRGTSESRAPWLGLHFGVPDVLAFRLRYMMAAGRYLSNIFTGDPTYNPGTGVIESYQYQLELLSDVSMFEADLTIPAFGDDRWNVELGAWYRRRLRSDFTRILRRRDEVVPGFFSETEVEREQGGHLGSKVDRFGPVGMGSLSVPLTSWLMLQPELSVRLDVPALSDGVGLQALSVGGGASLLFGLNVAQRDTTAFPPLNPPRIPDAAPPRLVASVDLYSIDEQGVPSQISATRPLSVLTRQQVPFPDALFFDEGSTALPERYIRLTPAEAARFSTDELARLAPRDIYFHGLNLLGQRMRRHRAAKVTLVAFREGDEPTAVPTTRAESVRSYLHDIWGIDRRRITTRIAPTSGTYGSEAQSILIETTREITAPITTEWRAQSYSPLAIDLRPEIEAESGVREWSVAVRQGERVITQYSSNSQESPAGADLALHIPEGRSDTALPPLVAELTVEDSAGGRVTALDSLPLIRHERLGQGSMPQKEEKRSRNVYLLHWYEGEGGQKDVSRKLLRKIARDSGDATRIAVSAEAGGACIFCEDVAATLRSMMQGARTAVEIARTREPRTGANLPEDKALGRLIRVEVEEHNAAR